MKEYLLNKLHFLSLFLARFVCIFVSYSYTNKRNIFFMRFINDIIKPSIRIARSSALVILGLLLSLSASAQGWERYYDFEDENGDEEAAAIIQTIDQGYAIVGRTDGAGPLGYEVLIIRLDVDGTVLWKKAFGNDIASTDEFGYDIIETPDQGLVIVGETNLGGPFDGRDVFLLKIDKYGEFLWQKFYGSDGDDRGYGLKNTQDGGFILTGSSNDFVYVVKTDSEGVVEWESTYTDDDDNNGVGNQIIETPGGDFIIAGSMGDNSNSNVFIGRINNLGQELDFYYYGGPENDVAHDIIRISNSDYVVAGKINDNSDFYILKLVDSGASLDLQWAYGHGLGSITEEAKSIIQTKDNNFILAGFSDLGINLQASMLKISGNGEDIIWQKDYGRTGLDAANDIINTFSGGFVFTGFTTEPSSFFPQDVLLVKTDQNGERVFTNHIIGKVAYDDGNCVYDGSENGINNWIVKAVDANDITYYAVTNELGEYDIPLPMGSYTVSVVTPNSFWLPCFSHNLSFPDVNGIIERHFPVNAPDIACTDLEIDVSTTFVKACEQAVYTVSYCNHGTIEAEGIQIGLTLSKNLDYVSSPPFSTFIDSLYVFDVADLDIGECASFEIVVEASCDAILSEAHSIKAYISPDNICQTYDGPEIEVNGYCDGDSVRFEITNTGAEAMNSAVDYIVIEDIVMGLQEQPEIPALTAGETYKFAYNANGATYRLVAKQIEGHPRNSISPSIAIEGCVDGGGTDYSTGFYTQLPEDDRDHFLATDCQENIPSTFDSQKKRGYPKGYGDSFKIASTTDLKYHIKFQNVGTDTAIRVVIRDTISPYLDPQTVRPGASSHDYDFEVYDNGILKFTFNNIMLIDSSTNEAASHGFVKYRITQKPDNPEGSIIKNGAAIFFDYQAPLETDSVCNVVAGDEWTDFIITSDHEIYIPKTEIKVYPNPVSQFATFELESPSIKPPLDFEIFDVAGKLVRSERFYESTFTFNRGHLPAGLYFYQISSKNQLISTGKIITK